MNQEKFSIELRPSRYFFTLISGVHLSLLFIACIADIAWWMLLIIFITITISQVYLLFKYIYRRSRFSIIGLWQKQETTNPTLWQIKFFNNKIVSGKLLSRGYMSNYLVIMYFSVSRLDLNTNSKLNHILNLILSHFKKFNTKTIPVLIFPDMLDATTYIALKRFLQGY